MGKTSDSKVCRVQQTFRDGRLVRLRVRERSTAGDYRDVDGEALRAHLASLIEGQKALRLLAREASRQCSLEDVVKKMNTPARATRGSKKSKPVGDRGPNR